MSDIIIRTATKEDIEKIKYINNGEEGPWAEYDTCRSWVTRRLERNFYIQIAELDGEPVGHGEWIVSDEPKNRTLYLGQLQVAKAYQRLGIGKMMLADGETQAKKQGCSSVTLIPDTDTGSQFFYEKCGYQKGRQFLCTEADVCINIKHEAISIIDTIPERAIHEKNFIFGLSQAAARHMWEVISHKPDCDNRKVKCAAFPDGSYSAVFWVDDSQTASALAFSEIMPDIALGHCFNLADIFGIKRISLVFDACNEIYLSGYSVDKVEEYNYEMIKYIS